MLPPHRSGPLHYSVHLEEVLLRGGPTGTQKLTRLPPAPKIKSLSPTAWEGRLPKEWHFHKPVKVLVNVYRKEDFSERKYVRRGANS